MSLLKLNNLTKMFGKNAALKNINLEFAENSVIGLIGMNGCGKTTLLRHLTGLYLPTTGEVTVFDTPSDKIGDKEMSKIGVVTQQHRFLEWMTVKQHLKYIASFYTTWDVELQDRMVKDFNLDLKANVGTLSPGNVQKMAIIMAVCHHPDILILDEPASAMDPITRRTFLNLLFELLEYQFKTIIISSHVLTDIENNG